jgi:hypothetical protein
LEDRVRFFIVKLVGSMFQIHFKAVLWIRIRIRIWIRMDLHGSAWIRMDPHHFGNLDSHPDPHPHQIKSGPGSASGSAQSDKLDPEPDPDPHQFAGDNPKHMEYEPI